MAACVAALAIAAGLAHAAPEEIQVYTDDLNRPGQVGLELHINDVLSGDNTPDHPGGQSSVGRWRLTPEWSYGLSHTLEFGAYVPLMTLDSSGTARVDGYKFRLKWLPHHPEQGLYWGLNYEVGRTDHHLDVNPWNNEVKLIAGWNTAHWLIGGNVNVDWALTGPERSPPTLELTSKLGYKLPGETLVGIESYNGIGATNDFGRIGRSEQSTFVTASRKFGRFDAEFGVGHGYGSNSDGVIVKLIVGTMLGR